MSEEEYNEREKMVEKVNLIIKKKNLSFAVSH